MHEERLKALSSVVSSGVLSNEARISLHTNPGLRLIGFLHGLFSLLGSSGELPKILSRFLADLGEYLQAEGGFMLSTADPTNLRLLAEFGAPFIEEAHDPDGIADFYDELIRKQRPALASGATREAHSLIGIPLVTEKHLIGVIVFFRNDQATPFIAEDIPLLSVVSQPLAIHLENIDQARVTAARRAEVEAILSSMEDGLLVVDRMGGVLSFNNALERLTRFQVAELYSLAWEDLVTTS
ncbi:MAG: GAF domain-containing protein, partial [Cyanobacteria bacterium REEB65]|nr:GAF domain-containing protein [Cyanobacteria bacterium REEB65]